MEEEMSTKEWTTKNGRKIRIKDLDDGHLVNIVRMLDRAHAARVLMLCAAQSMVNGDMAQFSLEQEERALDNAGPAALWPIYEDLVEEVIRRKLK